MLLTACDMEFDQLARLLESPVLTSVARLCNAERMDWHAARIALTLALLPPSPLPLEAASQ